MDSQIYYLKYRPQKISELDLKEVRQGLEKILKSGKTPHALLFSGPKGTGKTSAARIVAKAVNCQHTSEESPVPLTGTGRAKPTSEVKWEPCNKCEICQEITTGAALDLIEIDAASNRGIDDIRNLREKIKLSPAKCLYKVYIVDEAHMLTPEAFNALLKTLEEPPKHAIFILCTTAPEKLPKTIVSRCLEFKFKKATVGEIVDSLKRVVGGEKLTVEGGVLEEIARNVDGSFRDGQKILDQLTFGGKKISLAETKKLLGKIEELSPQKLLEFLAKRETKSSLLEISRVVSLGADLGVYIHGLLEELRRILLAKLGMEVEGASGEEIRDWRLEIRDLKTLIELFSQAALEIKTSPIPQLPLELAVVEWCEGEKEGVRAPLFSETRAGGEGSVLRSGGDSASLQTQASPRLNIQFLAGGYGPTSSDLVKTSPHANPPRTPEEKDEQTAGSPRPKNVNLGEILGKWADLLAQVRPLNHSVEALLRAARPLKLDGEVLTIEVFYKFHKERLETDKCRLVVEEVASQILGAPIRLKCVLGEKKNTERTDETIKHTDYTDEDENDIVKVASEIFNGRIVD